MKYKPPEPEKKEVVYKFVGDGLGIPGLPHEITKQEAEKQGILSILLDAIDKQVYIPIHGGE